MRRVSWLVVLAAAACNEVGVLSEKPGPPDPDLELTLEHPLYGEFSGGEFLSVRGSVNLPKATVTVEGIQVPVSADGKFRAKVGYDRPWRNIDVVADYKDQHAEIHEPTFYGTDPMLSWPGAITARLTPTGLNHLGGLLGGLVDSLIGPSLFQGLLPQGQTGGISLQFKGLTHNPTQVALTPKADALAAKILIRNLKLSLQVQVDLGGGAPLDLPVDVTFDRVGIALDLGVSVDDKGSIVLTPGKPDIDLSVPALDVVGVDLAWLASLLNSVINLGDLLTQAIQGMVGSLGSIPIAGPLAFDTDLLGTSLSIRLDDLVTDASGVGLALGVGIGAPIPESASSVPFPEDSEGLKPDLLLGAHDALLQSLLKSDLIDFIDQDFALSGFAGNMIGNIVGQIPGADQAPPNNGWCLHITPGEARLARFSRGEGPLVGIYLPDASLTFSTVSPEDGSCVPWLDSKLALEVGLSLDGTSLSPTITAPEARVVSYGAADIDPDLVAEKVRSTVSGLLGLLGGVLGGGSGGLGIDLGDLLGGFDLPGDLDLAISVQGVAPMYDAATGEPIDGMSVIGLNLFADPAPATP